MCKRYRLNALAKQLAKRFAVVTVDDISLDACPGVQVPVVLVSRKSGQRELRALQWGLIPNWAKDPAVGIKLYNARAETLFEKPSFRESARQRRCLIPATVFYEGRQMVEIGDGTLIAFAGIWDRWQSLEGNIIVSCSLVTVEATGFMSAIHHRMPAIVEGSQWLEHGVLEPVEPQHSREMA